MTFYDVWLKHKSFIFNITSKHITSASEGLSINPSLLNLIDEYFTYENSFIINHINVIISFAYFLNIPHM